LPEKDHEIKVYPLHEKREYYPVLAYWSYKEWYTGREIPFELNLRAYAARAEGTGLPAAFVALAGTFPAGMASLKLNDLWSRKDLNPWLASLWVEPSFRNRGAGRSLVLAVEEAARAAGFPRIYLFLGRHEQERLAGFYESLGWKYLQPAADNDGYPTTIYAREFKTDMGKC
jgi:GNAT superfamily N-acetyltransferase